VSDGGTSQPAGWYYAQGDPPGTQRYWDGTQWVGGPQAAQGASEPGAYGQQPAGGYGVGGGVPAEWGTRALAFLIDAGLIVAGSVVLFVVPLMLSIVSEGLASVVSLLLFLALLGFAIWNQIILLGQGASIGKQKMNIRLVADATGQPVGAGMAFVRGLLGGLFSFFCYIPLILDYLWPLWDDEKKRLVDKIFKYSVVQA
jgi:uncharacterized RDD family membrane protein YckC